MISAIFTSGGGEGDFRGFLFAFPCASSLLKLDPQKREAFAPVFLLVMKKQILHFQGRLSGANYSLLEFTPFQRANKTNYTVVKIPVVYWPIYVENKKKTFQVQSI